MEETITKTEENHVIVEKTITIPDKTEAEEFDQERLDAEKIRAQEELTKAKARIAQLDVVQKEMDKKL